MTTMVMWLLVGMAVQKVFGSMTWKFVQSVQLWWESVSKPAVKLEFFMTEVEKQEQCQLDSDEAKKKSKSVGCEPRDEKEPGKVQCFDPATGQHLGCCKAMSREEVDKAVQKAAKAQVAWSKTTFKQRRHVLRTLQRYILEHAEDICRVCARDSGKSKVDALLGEVMTTCEKVRTIVAHGEDWLAPSYRPTGPMMMHKAAYVQYVPLGVLGVIAPWNYPFHNMLNHVISGLFAGNAVVTKVSEYTSWSSAGYFARMLEAALLKCGHDPDVVQVITGFAEAGNALVANPQVDKIIFTGSPKVGRLVMQEASKHLKPLILELGGKDPMVFCDDVDLKTVVPWAMRGCFQNCGQNCCGVERLLVYESIHDEFIDMALRRIKALRQGPPLPATTGSTPPPCGVDCGAMVMEGQINHIQTLLDDALAKGAVLHCGGTRNQALGHGQFFAPTLISGVTLEMKIAQQEVFGPVMCVIKVPKDDDEACLRLIHGDALEGGGTFGLGCSVYSASKERALKIGERIRSGMCTVNDFGVNYLIQSLPFGGIKESGFGRFAGPEGLQACCHERSMVVDRIPGVKTSIPPALDYPIDTTRGMGFGTSLLQLFYSASVWEKVKGIVGLIKYG